MSDAIRAVWEAAETNPSMVFFIWALGILAWLGVDMWRNREEVD